jgi:hypothetical protein
MQDPPTAIKRQVCEWAGVAHDRELSKALQKLRTQFDRWERAEISAADLNDLIHRFHDGESREIWKKYATNHPEPALGLAVATTIIRREELPPSLAQYLARVIELYEGNSGA